jgi:GTP pyrophosphokinase
MTGAKINGVIVPIDKIPGNGDIIEIITSNSSKGPSRDWLKIVKTGQARSKIRQWFKKEKRTENIQVGKNEVEREFKRVYKQITDAQINDIVCIIGKRVGINSADDFYNTLGFGGISLSRFMTKAKEEIEKIRTENDGPLTAEEELAKVKLTDVNKRSRKSGGVIIDGEAGYAVKFAKCCNPLPGDRIVGFVTRGFGVSVHKADCPNVIASRGNADNLARWVRAQWEEAETTSYSSLYEAMIQIIAEDGIGVLAGISMALADMKVSISQINTQPTKDGDVAINIVVGCRNVDHYDSIVSRLRNLPKIISVRRGFMN